jgi:hypothetical protein
MWEAIHTTLFTLPEALPIAFQYCHTITITHTLTHRHTLAHAHAHTRTHTRTHTHSNQHRLPALCGRCAAHAAAAECAWLFAVLAGSSEPPGHHATPVALPSSAGEEHRRSVCLMSVLIRVFAARVLV